MKKIVSILVLILLLFYSITSFALAKPVTKESLNKAFSEYAKGFSGSYTTENGGTGVISFGESKQIEVTDNQLIDKNDSQSTFYVDYTLGDSPKFSTKIEITPETEYDVVGNLSDSLKGPMLGLLGTILSQDIEMGDAAHYYDEQKDVKIFKNKNSSSFTRLGNQISITLDDETKNYENGKINFDELIPFLFEENKVIKDEKFGIYTYTVGYKKKSDNNYTVEAVLEINKNADFSKIGKVTNGENSNKENKQNNNTLPIGVINKNTTNNTKNNTVNKIVNNSANNARNLANISDNQKLPKAGTDNVLPILITFFYVIAIVFAIRIIRFKEIR